MSYQIGIDALNLRPTPRLAHTEYCDHAPLKRAVTGLPDGHRNRAARSITPGTMTSCGPPRTTPSPGRAAAA